MKADAILLAVSAALSRSDACQEGSDVGEAETLAAADGYPFALQCGLCDPPPVVDVAHNLICGNPHIREEDLVEVGSAVDLA